MTQYNNSNNTNNNK